MILLRLCKLILATVQIIWCITDTWLDIKGVELTLESVEMIWYIADTCAGITDTFSDIKGVVQICHQRSKRSGGVGHVG